MCRIAIIILCALLSVAYCFGQSSYKGVTPGQSTRADAERVLGQPVKSLSKTLAQYEYSEEVVKVYVQYRDESPTAIVERIELTCFIEEEGMYNRCMSALNTGQLKGVLEDVESRTEQRGHPGVVRYYGAPRFLVETITGKGVDTDVRLAYYSKKLYESAVPKGGCTGTILGTWQTERGRMTVVRVGDSGIQGTYSTNNGSFTLKQVSGGYMGEWKDDTGSGTMALMLYDDSFTASLSRGAAAPVSSKQSPARSKVGSEIEKILKSGKGAAVGPIITEPSEPSLSRITGLPPGEPLTGKCIP